MRVNPEIQRNIWLEFSLHRLIAMPFVIGVIFFITSRIFEDALTNIVAAASAIFFVVVKLWGGYKAADSVLDEVNDRTWDFQKLSALSPLSLTIGKLFGSTLYSWYGAIIPVAVFAIAAPSLPYADHVGWNIALFILSGVIVHAGALLSSLAALTANEEMRKKSRPIIHLAFGLLLGSTFSSFITASTFSPPTTPSTLPLVKWYGVSYDFVVFQAFTAVLVLAWLIAGIYWQMRGQMKMKTGPWLWAAFLLFWGYFIAGFGYPSDAAATGPARNILPLFGNAFFHYNSVRSFLFAAYGLYFIAFQEPLTGVHYRRLADAWGTRNYARWFELCPRWIPAFLICILFALGTPLPDMSSMLPAFTLLCFAIRDIAILHFFKLSPKLRRPVQTTSFYLAVFYVLVPFLLNAFHAKPAMVYFLPALVYPTEGDMSAALPVVAVQALLAVILAVYQWRRHWTKYDERPASQL